MLVISSLRCHCSHGSCSHTLGFVPKVQIVAFIILVAFWRLFLHYYKLALYLANDLLHI